ncbi:uncharacterized protein LOC132201348 isoform X2 [Neocloeon triangulifer]|uniref:uncharacterized protein LOC132201348 isoform X2 n=1 Tax=Neocloeon triangulifer TaxID=2078957 RepID=UPI00286EF0C2|nr:uncharacterized protein LOC132201348 isoform X2 [Neocloeon triangulifer]XP_059483438.1 uncharacterized protein LOC132201348 isoform X2 [Neocloeon triangulifer]
MDYKGMSPADRCKIVKLIQRKRNESSTRKENSKIESLKILSMEQIYKTFMYMEVGSLKKLPNTLVQEFFGLISRSTFHKSLTAGPSSVAADSMVLVAMLLNTYTTEFDGQKVFLPKMPLQEWEKIFTYILNNCPNMSRISQTKLSHLEHPLCPTDLQNLTKLEHVSLSSYVFTDEHLHLIQQHLPRLKHLEISMAKNTEKAAVAFSKMQNLKHLSITPGCHSEPIDLELLVHCAGQTPNLQHMHLAALQMDFAFLFGTMYPYKELVIAEITVWLPIERDWPSNVSVKCLFIECFDRELHAERLSSVPCSPAVLGVNADPDEIYMLVKILGQDTNTINIKRDQVESEKMPLDLYVILEHCPNLESLNFYSIGFCEPHNMRKSPEAFRKLIEYNFLFNNSTYELNQVLEEVSKVNEFYKMFLLGSERHNCKDVIVYNVGHILAILEALVERPDCLKPLEDVILFLQHDPMLDLALKMVQCLIFHSPNLKSITCILSETTSLRESSVYRDHSWFEELVTQIGIRCLFLPRKLFTKIRQNYSGDSDSDTSSSEEEEMEIDDDVVME